MCYSVEILQSALDFIDKLPVKMGQKVLRAIALLELYGYELREPESKTLKNADGLKELRVQFSSDICRLFYFHFRGKLYVITSGYKKKELKTKRSEIDRALRIMKQYIRERNDD